MGFAERKRWLFFGLPFTFTKYFVEEEILTVRQGLLKVVENDCYIYKIQDVEHSATLFERMFGLGTITCFTGDTTHPTLQLVHIRNSKEIKKYLLEQSEKMRIKRRTVNMLDIGNGGMADVTDDVEM
ncbi:MAG: PH domain-containing protein [Lachnospiraceae bacterium]|nr:PH domain-containing protein [Lachnospiraceae bacterium]